MNTDKGCVRVVMTSAAGHVLEQDVYGDLADADDMRARIDAVAAKFGQDVADKAAPGETVPVPPSLAELVGVENVITGPAE
ncbi:MAG: hypothetical protein EPO06_12095 [Burkholderiaceae bacterium]|nr:MAG: hypothetical protein EPO06_12095 [Burkholderiaceae bacterium]